MTKKKRGRGRPKGSTNRGPTVQVTFRVPKALFDEVERLRRRAEALSSRTSAFERLLRKGIEAEESS